MKPSTKRLSLAKETLRTLDRHDLTRAAGASTGPCQAVDDWFHLPSNFCVQAPRIPTSLRCPG